ncbi:MAG: LacI family DNA-binding transcriptional regulator [Pseudomonadota bacterium]
MVDSENAQAATGLSKAEGSWATMGDVARQAGVSKITVSRVLRQPDRVKPDTRDRVRAAIRELGYVPDDAASAFSSRKSRTVGALISTLDGSTFASTVDGLSDALREAGFQLLISTTEYSPQTEADNLTTLLGRRPDGLVLTSTEHTPAARTLMARLGLPVVELWDLPEEPIDCAVGFSNFDSGAAMTHFLFERSYRRPAFVGSQSGSDTRVTKRMDGYLAAVRERGLGDGRVVRLSTGGSKAIERGAKGLARLLERWPDTDAVFCSSDSVALGVLNEARRRGLRVPEDIAVAGYGDFDFAGPYGLELTTLRIPGYEIGTAAAALILERTRNPEASSVSADVGFKIIKRRTA